MSSAIDLRNWPVPAIVPPVPANSSASGSDPKADRSRLTRTSDETGDFAIRLSPDFGTGASEMRIKVAAILQEDSACSHGWPDWPNSG